jgi:hypothetical protein
MSRLHLLLLCSALPLVACGDDGGPSGPIRSYVVSEASVPTSSMQATEFGLDLNGDKVVDNQLGAVLAALSSQGFNVQGAVTKAIKEGSIILLVDFQAKDIASGSAGLSVKLGDMPMPAACSGTTDTVCGHHLDGTGSFAVAANSPQNAAVEGKIVGGTFNGGPGDIALEIALGGTQPIQLDLIGARAKASGLSETGIDSLTVGGALTIDDLNTKVIPAIYAQISPLVTADCPGTTPPGCGCTAGSTGATILNLFDTAPKDCKITVDEIANNTLIKSLLAPDVTIEGKMALSLGLKAKAVKATIR